MKRVATILAVLLLILSLSVVFRWNGNEKPLASENSPLTASEYQGMLGAGINVDWMTFGWVNHYYFYWRSKGVNVPKYFKEEGFSNVRIRVSEDVVTNRTALFQLGEVVNDTLKAV